MSSLFGTSAEAEVITAISSIEPVKNSQTMALLKVEGSGATTLYEKKNPTDEPKQDAGFVGIVGHMALYPTTNRVVKEESSLGGPYSDQISVYVVRKGDSISQIAEMYEVSVNTILWSNDLKKTSKIKEGDVLFILPISGVEHIVKKGETLSTISKKYKADVSDIIRFNGIAEATKVSIGDKLIIPGGEIYNEASSSPSSSVARSQTKYTATGSTSGYFINPVPGYSRRSQNLHGPGNRGVDLAAKLGTPIYASAGGKVYFARTGWNGAYGNLVIIDHANGTRTLYAHLSKIQISTGANVEQGEQIGTVGSTGRSTGPHLHFEVFNAKNPGSDWSWKN